jgi:hypothetical protein
MSKKKMFIVCVREIFVSQNRACAFPDPRAVKLWDGRGERAEMSLTHSFRK